MASRWETHSFFRARFFSARWPTRDRMRYQVRDSRRPRTDARGCDTGSVTGGAGGGERPASDGEQQGAVRPDDLLPVDRATYIAIKKLRSASRKHPPAGLMAVQRNHRGRPTRERGTSALEVVVCRHQDAVQQEGAYNPSAQRSLHLAGDAHGQGPSTGWMLAG